MIVGTAGHIDHGKTTLVRALTGVDTDRLPDEKRRGITIELGFAPLALDGLGTVGVVDVPGHEAFVRTMLAGAAGIDVGLLVIAADDGVRPQTREHLAILELLAVRGGVIALTKCDLVEQDWIGLVEEDVRELVAGTAFADAPVIRVCPGDESALAAVRGALGAALRVARPRDPAEPFRLPVDRVFSIRGTGTVVTGTAWSGSVAPDSEVRILPAGRSARVRGVQVHGAAADRALPGQRTAIALGGTDVSDVHRGDVIVQHAAWEPSLVLRADVALLGDAPASLGPRSSVRFHLGTTEVGARLVAQGGPLEAGQHRPVRVVLDAPVTARAGDRFVLRLPSPPTTIGGGTVTDPHATRRSRPFPTVGLGPAERLSCLLSEAGPRGISRASLLVRVAVSAAEVDPAVAGSGAVGVPGSDRLLSRAAWDEARARMLEFLDGYHRDHPLASGASRQELRARLRLPAEFSDALVQAEVKGGTVQADGAEIRKAGWAPTLTPAQASMLDAILGRLRDAGREPPSVSEISSEFGAGADDLLRLAAARGEVAQVDANRYYAVSHLDQIITALDEHYSPDAEVAPTEVREVLGLSRKFVIPLLEYADRAGLTRRRGDGRVWVGPARAAPGHRP